MPALWVLLLPAFPQGNQEEAEDYFKKWLDEDVVYIITPEERQVFEKLTTPEEKEQFIEQFWRRRDPDLTTPVNEFKEEHYRRLAYVNERFKSGVPGWKTDRGRIYIIHGPPDEIEKHYMGQSYQRPSKEGGGMTVTYPFEIWRYRHIPGLGENIELEFVDPSGSGEFRLAKNPWEKDALLMIPGAGLTIAEELGVATRADHPYFKPYNWDNYRGMHVTERDDPFVRYDLLVRSMRPRPIKYQDLKQLVEVDISYQLLPFEVQTNYFRMGEERVLAAVSFEVAERELAFQPENVAQVARVALYGLVTDFSNQVVAEFDDDLVVARPLGAAPSARARAVYQRVLPLDARRRYRLDLVVKDQKGAKVGHRRVGLIPPRYPSDQLSASSLVLADFLAPAPEIQDPYEPFLLGDLKVRPAVNKTFHPGDPLWIYLQLYNVQFDQATGKPQLTVTYRLRKDSRDQARVRDRTGESFQYVSESRVVLAQVLPLDGLAPGRYEVSVEVEDQLSGKSLQLSDEIVVADD
ncbi:MAG: hypothetical protein Kow00109_09650 [Acidobacteriota bacterium]